RRQFCLIFGPGLRRCALSSVRAVGAGVGSSSRALDAVCGAADAASAGQIFSNFDFQTKNATLKRNSTANPFGQICNFSLTGSKPKSYSFQNESGTIFRS